jgi:hypothetical protein
LALRGRARHGCSEDEYVRGGQDGGCPSHSTVSPTGLFPSAAPAQAEQDAAHHEPAQADASSRG